MPPVSPSRRCSRDPRVRRDADNTTILLSASSVALAVVLYLSTIFGGRELMKGRKPYSGLCRAV